MEAQQVKISTKAMSKITVFQPSLRSAQATPSTVYTSGQLILNWALYCAKLPSHPSFLYVFLLMGLTFWYFFVFKVILSKNVCRLAEGLSRCISVIFSLDRVPDLRNGGEKNLVLQLMFTEEMVSVGGWLLGNREKRRRYAELYKNLP